MAHISEIEQLPGDILSEILIRVGQSSTAEEMAGIFVVSKTFRNHMEDRNVLRAISFRHVFPILAESYEPLLEIGGLVARCAKANNPDAQFILAKLLMIGASKLRKAKIGVAQDVLIDKATRLLHHFSAENTDITELVSLIRSFLSRVDFTGLHKMRRHLRDFVILYRLPGKKPQRQQFLICLDKFCLRNSPPPAFTLLPYIVIVRSFNELCITIHAIRQTMGCVEEQLRPVLDCMVVGNDIGCETFLKHLDFVEPTLRIHGHGGDNVDDEEVSGFNSFVSGRVSKLRYELRQVMDYDAFFRNARQEVLASFDALFDIQQLHFYIRCAHSDV